MMSTCARCVCPCSLDMQPWNKAYTCEFPTEQWERTLNNIAPKLIEKLQLGPLFLSHLVQLEALQNREEESIQDDHRGREAQVETLLRKVRCGPHWCIPAFFRAMALTHQQHLIPSDIPHREAYLVDTETPRPLATGCMHTDTSDSRLSIEDQFYQHLRREGFDWYAEHDAVFKPGMKEDFLDFYGGKLGRKLEREKADVEMKVKRGGLDIKTSNTRRDRPLRCVLLGKTGAGKSSLGNLLVGKDVFDTAATASAVTQKIKLHWTDQIGIIDAPGFGDPDPKVQPAEQLIKVFDAFREGIHVFLFTTNLANCRLTNDDNQVLTSLKGLIGRDMKPHTILVGTHLDSFTGELESLVNHMKLSDTVDCVIGDHFLGVDNTSQGYERELFQRGIIAVVNRVVEEAVNNNQGECYTHDIFRELQKHDTEIESERQREAEETNREIEENAKPFVVKQLQEAQDNIMSAIALLNDEQKKGEIEHRFSMGYPGNRSYAVQEIQRELYQETSNYVKEYVDRTVLEFMRSADIDTDTILKQFDKNIVDIVGEKDIRLIIEMYKERTKVKKLRELERERQKRREADIKQERKQFLDRQNMYIQELRVLVKAPILQYICDQTKEDLSLLKTKPPTEEFERVLSDIVEEVEAKLDSGYKRYLGVDAVEKVVVDSLSCTLENVTNANIIKQIRIWLAYYFGGMESSVEGFVEENTEDYVE